jgi:DNA modification methylase
MPQEFKSIYFPDFPADSAKQKNLTLAFGRRNEDLYKAIKPLSSHEIRELLGHSSFNSLQIAASRRGLNINLYCLNVLRSHFALRKTTKQETLPFAAKPSRPLIEPIQATFRGGQKEPLHEWFPYLEGYSPLFVEQVIEEFAPDASVVLDPFAGTGTTALTAAKLGRTGLYCELNPLLQFLIEVKVLATTLNTKERQRTARVVQEIAADFRSLITRADADLELQIAYSRTFSHSQFFESPVYEDVLRARTALDRFACDEPFAVKLLTVGILSSLVDCSRLIRRGDLRFRNKKEQALTISDLAAAIKPRIERIANDLERLTPISQRPLLICEDARSLEQLPPLQVEAIITSPPYPNGTNYFRNTKLELWFLRCLRTANDLSDFRLRAITAGINDVTASKQRIETTDEIASVVDQLNKTAYDARIPKMIGCYFGDIKRVFSSVKKHLVPGAKIIIDIGDSAYGGVHVPSHSLMASVLRSEAYTLEREIQLRKRTGRGRLPLTQALLVFRYQGGDGNKRRQLPSKIFGENKWKHFKTYLPHQQDDFAKRNWGHPLHSLCSYQGKMKPSLASHLVSAFLSTGDSMLDPFAGVGTIPFEAALCGVKAYGFEISPAALHIAAAKLSPATPNECDFVMDSLQRFLLEEKVTDQEIESARAIHFNGPLIEYFEKRTLRELLLARRYFRINPPQSSAASLVFASLLHILHGNRPYALSRRSHPITPFAPTGDYEYRPLMPRLRDKVRRSLEVTYQNTFTIGKMFYQDATNWWPQEVKDLAAIITSPPFFDSTRFYLANWMRLWFCGWEATDFKSQPLAFVDERQKRSFRIYESIFRQGRERLRPNGVFVLHLGKSKKCDMATELTKIASPWFRVADTFTEDVEHCESHGIRDKGTVTAHQFVVLH